MKTKPPTLAWADESPNDDGHTYAYHPSQHDHAIAGLLGAESHATRQTGVDGKSAFYFHVSLLPNVYGLDSATCEGIIAELYQRTTELVAARLAPKVEAESDLDRAVRG